MTEKYTLTDEHRKVLDGWAEPWIANAMATGPYSEEELEAMPGIMRKAYSMAGLPTPQRVLRCGDPVSTVFASTLSEAYRERAEEVSLEVFAISARATLDAAEQPSNLQAHIWQTVCDALGVERFSLPDAPDAPDAGMVAHIQSHVARWGEGYDGGSNWSPRACFLSFHRLVTKLARVDWSAWEWEERAAVYGPRMSTDAACIVSERPTVLKVDDQNLPHSEDGPFCAWPSGRALYAWHGDYIPAEWIENKESLDPSLALTHPNVEQRRILAEIIGWHKVLDQLPFRVICEDPNPEIGSIVEVVLPGEGEDFTARFLRARCPTGRDFALSLPDDVNYATPLDAQADLAGIPRELYELDLHART